MQHRDALPGLEVKCIAVYVCVPLRIRALSPLIPGCQAAALADEHVECPCFIAVRDVEQDLPGNPHIAIVPRLTVHAHHTVDAGLETIQGESLGVHLSQACVKVHVYLFTNTERQERETEANTATDRHTSVLKHTLNTHSVSI